jgi:hypothetical protein
MTLPDVMQSVERRTVDGVSCLGGRGSILEVDEPQHFKLFRAATLRCYHDGLPVAFECASGVDPAL